MSKKEEIQPRSEKKLKDGEQLSPLEVRIRIERRIKYQDRVLFPQRQKEGQLTPVWKKYAKKRGL